MMMLSIHGGQQLASDDAFMVVGNQLVMMLSW